MIKLTSKYQRKILGIPTSDTELKDILKAWLAISIAFTILLSGFKFDAATLQSFILSAFTVGTAFLFHELGHKFMAQRYNFWAEFRAFDKMLILAIIFSFFGFIFAAPGAVMIKGYRICKKENGMISLMGPLVNFVMAIVFFFILFSPVKFISLIASYGFLINSWIGLFNLIPFGMFDGAKILRWNKVVYGVMVTVGICFLVMQQVF